MRNDIISMRLPPIETRAIQMPADQALISLSLLQGPKVTLQPGALGWHAEQPDEIASWVTASMRALSQAELDTNQLIFTHLAHALIPNRVFASFPEYLSDLGATPAAELRSRLGDSPAPAVHALYSDPPKLKQLLIEHLGMLWERVLADEWRRQAPMLQYVTQSVHQRNIPPSSAPIAIRAVLGRDLPIEITAQLAGIQTLIIVPCLHVGIFLAQYGAPSTLTLFVNWGIITSWALRQGPLRPAEIRARVAPLADENGLKILDLLAQNGELSSQELIATLATSQSSISRYLKSLGSYLVERRGEGANKHYQISYSYLDWTIVMLRRFLEADLMRIRDAAQTVGPQRTSAIPTVVRADLKRFSDSQGLLTAFPTRRNDQLLVLTFLAERFEHHRSYSEREVNAIIKGALSPLFDDFATLRRELYNYGFLGRERDGSRYWRVERSE